MDRKYFGTDGIRGPVGAFPITAEFMLKLGWAAGKVLIAKGHNKVLIGKDTRISGYMFESALEAGFSAAGVNVALLGPIPTPGIAYLTRTQRACAGVVISASHNPYDDNGIKFFSRDGRKLADEVECRIEAMLDEPLETVSTSALGKAQRVEDATGRYIEFCKSTIPATINLAGLKIVIDCANGATYNVAPSVFSELGATVLPINVSPNGFNINLDCGSTRPAGLQKAVKEQGADLGVAFDGDGDRVIMVDHRGEILDGDELLFIIARDRARADALPVVGTLMTNLGLELALNELGIALRRTKVGDRYILECMHAEGLMVGGESSGHIICLDRTTTGDGIISALQVITPMVQSGCSLHELKSGMTKFPQSMVNVPLERKVDFANCQPVQHAIRDVENRLGVRGRVLLRPSGTEPVVRVMVEGEQENVVTRLAADLATVVKAALAAQAQTA